LRSVMVFRGMADGNTSGMKMHGSQKCLQWVCNLVGIYSPGCIIHA